MGAILKFPLPQKAVHGPVRLPPVSPLERLDPEKTRQLHDVSENIVHGARALVNFLDTHRSVARAAGIEALTVEISGIIDSRRLESITDALDESVRLGGSSDISADGFYYLKRTEKLLAEAHEDLTRFTGSNVANRASFSANPIALGQAGPFGATIDYNTVILAALALVAIAIIALALK
jgi:hypothetical protein